MTIRVKENLVQLQSIGVDTQSLFVIANVASYFLNEVSLSAFGVHCQLAEIEVYAYSPKHPDPFVHRHEIQAEFGRWYFHRVGSGYKNGSFKGLDLTFGHKDMFGGVLIRSLATADRFICGPSKCVDFLLEASRIESVKTLDSEVYQRHIWDAESPLHFMATENPPKTVYHSSRVGLSLKPPASMLPERFILRRYRFLTSPRQVKKGRVNLILSMHSDGSSVAEIAKTTGSPAKTIEKYLGLIANYQNQNIDSLRTQAIGTTELCYLEGIMADLA